MCRKPISEVTYASSLPTIKLFNRQVKGLFTIKIRLAATGRILAFIKATPKIGRTEVLRENDWNLTIIGPEKSRPELLARIAQDARTTAAAFGPGYGVSVDGLQHPISWRQQGPLDLSLYIPYRLEVVPLAVR